MPWAKLAIVNFVDHRSCKVGVPAAAASSVSELRSLPLLCPLRSEPEVVTETFPPESGWGP